MAPFSIWRRYSFLKGFPEPCHTTIEENRMKPELCFKSSPMASPDNHSHDLPTSQSRAEVSALVEKIIASRSFAGTKSLQNFLKYITSAVLDNRGDPLKEYDIALNVFRRRESFDSRIDPIVRVQASRLRSKLKKYFREEGVGDRWIIHIPKGTYVPIIRDAAQSHLWEMGGSPGDETTIGVLPFLDLSVGRPSANLGDTLTEELIHMLTDMTGIRVCSRTSVFQFKDRAEEVRQIGKALGANILLEGSVRESDQFIRVRVRLIDVESGRQTRLYTCDRELNDNSPGDICALIVTALKLRLRES
jgi:serine/threonine-protein kinase